MTIPLGLNLGPLCPPLRKKKLVAREAGKNAEFQSHCSSRELIENGHRRERVEAGNTMRGGKKREM